MFWVFRIRRTVRIALLTIAVAVLFPFRRLFGDDAGPRLIRWYFQTCEAAFVKIGQLLAVRYDLFPAEYCKELGKLLDRVPPIPFASVKAIIEQDLGRDLRSCFQDFAEKPVAAASIAQVHYAHLHSEQEVAVKVMRPAVRRQFQVDLANARSIARALDLTGIFGASRIADIVSELFRIVEQELDFRKEARHTDMLRTKMMADDVDHYAPKVYFDFCGSRVITEERLSGIWVQELIDALVSDDRSRLDPWESKGVRPERIGRILFRSVMEQCYRHRLFHADPHASNLIVLDDGSLGFIDFGSVGWLDEDLWAKQRRVFDNIARRNIHGAYEALISTLEPFEERDLSDLEGTVKELFWEWTTAAEDPRASSFEKSNGRLLLRIADAIRKSSLRLPWRLIRVYRAQIVTDMIVYSLFPGLDPIYELSEFFNEEALRQAGDLLSIENLRRSVLTAGRTIAAAPEALAAITDWTTTKLPILGRTFGEDLSRFERGMTYLLDFARVISMLSGLGIVLLRISAAWIAPTASWRRPGSVFDEIWWIAAIAALGISFLLSRVLWHIKYSD